MRRLAVLLALLLALPLLSGAPPAYTATVSVWFSPNGGCTQAIVAELAQAYEANFLLHLSHSTPLSPAQAARP